MDKFIFIVIFICIISQISSISPPKFPATFYTSVKIIEQLAEVTQSHITGSIANDDAKQLYVYTEMFPPHSPFTRLFNKHYYQYYDNPPECTCSNVTYKNLDLPFFSRYKNFAKFYETDSDIIWKCKDISLNKTVFFTVRKETPNIPEGIMTYTIIGNATFSQNITFIGFRASQPDGGFFRVPYNCTKVPCQNTPKKTSLLFPKFLGD